MRLETCVLAAGLLCSAPALAQNAASAPQEEVVQKIQLSNQQPDDMVRIVAGTPAPVKKGELPKPGLSFPLAITGVLGYPLDASILVRGTPDALKVFREAVLTVDVKVEKQGQDGASTRITPRHLKPTELRTKLLALPDAGQVSLKDESLNLEGRADWVRAALHETLLAEITAR